MLHLGPPAAEFSEAISKVLPSVSRAESQPILNEAVLSGPKLEGEFLQAPPCRTVTLASTRAARGRLGIGSGREAERHGRSATDRTRRSGGTRRDAAQPVSLHVSGFSA